MDAAATIKDDVHAQLRDALARIAEHERLHTQRDVVLREHERLLAFRDAKIAALTAHIALLNRHRYGQRSEQFDPGQRLLFDETLEEDAAAAETELDALTPATARPRRQPKRLPLPEHLPRIEQRHEPASCSCEACGHALVAIGEDVTEQLDCEPAVFFVRRHVYPKYACRTCETIVAAPSEPALIERGRPGPGLLAHVLIGKYADHLPLYRQQQIYQRSGIELARSTLAEWVGAVGVALQPLVAAMKADLLREPVLHADETPVAVLDPGAGKTARAYLFAYGTATGAPITVFDFCASRSGDHARQFLGDYRGALVVVAWRKRSTTPCAVGLRSCAISTTADCRSTTTPSSAPSAP